MDHARRRKHGDHSKPVVSAEVETNRVLLALPPRIQQQLAPELERVELRSGQILWEPDAPIRSIYFPRTCVASLIVTLDGEQSVEAATIGREGIVGIVVALGEDSTSLCALAQVPGVALRIATPAFRAIIDREPEVKKLVLRHAQAVNEQTAQSVACNARHSMSERCARWLLMTHDRVSSDEFSLTHEFLAFMLGVRRATVTIAAGMLQQAGLIRYVHGRVTILDRPRLEEASCECYTVIRRRYDLLAKAAVS